MSTLLTSPPGRFVQGDVFDPQTKDQQGNPLVIKTGPNAGQPTQAWIINVAHSKTDPATLPYLLQLANLAKADWPAFFPGPVIPNPPLFGSSHPKFALKIMDGDGVDDNGKPNYNKPGMKGCWIVKYKTSLQAPKVFNRGEYDPMQQITDKRLLPKGSMVRVRVSVESNKNDTRPGMYMNPNMVEIYQVATGADIIIAGEGADDAFGAGAGVSHQSDRTGGLVMIGGADYNAYKAAGWSDEQMIAAGHAQRAAPPPPAHPPAPPAPPAAPAGIVPNPGIDLAAYRASGWTDDQLVAAGHATRPAPAAVAVPPPPSGVSPPPPPPAHTPAAPPPPAPGGATPSPSSVQPYGGYMAAGTPPPPPPAQETGGAPAGFTTTPAANGSSYAQLLASNWTHEMMLQHGMIRPL